MASPDEQLDPDFTEAANNWNLEKLYIDLAVAKGRGLTPVEKKFLRGLLCGYSPAEIAAQVYKSNTSSAVRVYLSNGLYKYIQQLLLQQGATGVSIKSWSRVPNLLEKAGYKLWSNPLHLLTNGIAKSAPIVAVNQSISKYQEWQAAIDIEAFYGRQQELSQLKEWIVKDGCRLVAILGMGGIGKTALAIKFAQQTQQQFEFLIWRSLKSAPLPEDLLDDLIRSLFPGQVKNSTVTVEAKIAELMAYLRSHRCLLVLDQADAILRPHTLAGSYRDEYEAYGQLFLQLGEERHKSCCIVTSREKPKDIATLAGVKLSVRSCQLKGLTAEESFKLLQVKGLHGFDTEQQLLSRFYASNPLVLKIVATTIQDVFDGDASRFLAEGVLVFGDIRQLLDQQFNRLSDLEWQVMYELATQPMSMILPEGLEKLVPSLSKWERLEAVESLHRRCLIDKVALVDKKFSFTQQPAIRVYVAQKLTEQMAQAMTNKHAISLVSRTILDSMLNNELTINHITSTSL